MLAPAALLFLAGCAGISPRPSGEASRIFVHEGDPLAGVPTAGLRGRVIVIDPGHGGRHAGAVGIGGLREADANLEVALILQRLLNEAGARAILTRASDRGVAEEESGLGEDLRARAAYTEELRPDIFLSIHHNSSLPLDRTLLATETYFRLGDDGPSLDAARLIHQSLIRTLGLPPGRLRPGNYLVLREAKTPAVLGEASFLSNPQVEGLLRSREGVRLEAQAYYAGLARYFSRGVPEIEEVVPVPSRVEEGEPHFLFRLFERGPPDRLMGGIDPGSVRVTLDGSPIPHLFDGRTGALIARVESPLSSGAHQVEVGARNSAGNAARPLRRDFLVDLPVESIRVEAHPATMPPGGDPGGRLTIRALDARGQPVADGTKLLAEVEGGSLLTAPSPTRGGISVCQLGAPSGRDPITVRVRPASTEAPRTAGRRKPDAAAGLPAASPDTDPSLDVSITLIRDPGPQSLLWGRVSCGGDHTPLAETRVWLTSPAPLSTEGFLLGIADAQGFFYLPCSRDSSPPRTIPGKQATLVARRPGYREFHDPVTLPPAETALRQDISLWPVAGGSLHDLRVVIDPAAGGDDTGMVDRAGFPAKDFNLLVAERLALALTSAGARPVLTREGDRSAGGPERVGLAEREGGELVLRIDCLPRAASKGRAEEAVALATVSHYPGSRVGKALAESLATVLGELDRGPVSVGETATFVVQQVTAPAVMIALHVLEGGETGILARKPHGAQLLAFALYQGLLAFGGPPPEETSELILTSEVGPREASRPLGALVLDGVLLLPTPTDHPLRLRRLGSGVHRLDGTQRVRHFRLPVDTEPGKAIRARVPGMEVDEKE